jgi:oligoendopeptidase F
MNSHNDNIPVWDNTAVFKSSDDPEINKTLELASVDIQKMAEKITGSLDIPLIQEMLKEYERLIVDLATIRSYAHACFSVDSGNESAGALIPKVSKVLSELSITMVPVMNFIQKTDEETITKILDDEFIKEMDFQIRYSREQRDFSLSDEEEKILEGMGQDGIHAWGRLYSTIAGSLQCEIDGELTGYANAANMMYQPDREKREKAWRSIQKAWGTHEDTIASVLSSINGWRLTENRFRSKKKDFHYFDKSCHESHINRKTLNSLMDTTYENREIGKRAIKGMAKYMKLDKLAPWDIIANAPVEGEGSYIPFQKGIDYIAEAYSELSPEMGEFVHMMNKKNWIDAKPTEKRSPGAYCTGFYKLREPRVFMTYDGGIGNITTLAHELGHAYHSWVMRDLPICRTHYAMTTAETASIFGETLVRHYLFEKLESPSEKLQIAWDDAMTASAMICNIPARFEFEKEMVEMRKQKSLSPSDLKLIMNNAWGKWYEDSLSEYDEMFWASKLHFSISEIGFYNYPYLFGLLFGLGIYSYKDQYGDKFHELYVNVLRDTGSMNAIDLIQKHFKTSIEDKDFWQNSLNILDDSVTRFESLI